MSASSVKITICAENAPVPTHTLLRYELQPITQKLLEQICEQLAAKV